MLISNKKLNEYSRLFEEFSAIVKGRNFVTPNILGYVEIENGVAKISEGRGILSKDPIYGVTIVKNGKHDYELSKPFHDWKKLKQYVQSIGGEL